MKISRVIGFLAIVSSMSVMSCSKKSEDVTPNQQQTQSGFSVKIDGKDYQPDFSYALATFPGGDGYYAVYGLDSKTSDVVAIALPNTATEGTHKLGGTTGFGVITINKEDFTTINGGEGTVTITKKTATNVTGTFTLTAYNPAKSKKLTLTEGKFNVAVR